MMDKSRKRPKNTSFDDVGTFNKRRPTHSPSTSLLSSPSPSSNNTTQAHTIKTPLSSKDNNDVKVCQGNNEDVNIFDNFASNAINTTKLSLNNDDNIVPIVTIQNEDEIDNLSQKITNMQPFANGPNANTIDSVGNEVDGNANATGSINPESSIIKSNVPTTDIKAETLESQTTLSDVTTYQASPPHNPTPFQNTSKTNQEENNENSPNTAMHTGNSRWGEIYSKIENISKPPLNASELEQLNKNGLWWNYIKADKRGLFLRLTPENILVNYIFQTKACCSAFYNDDLFNYLTFEQLFFTYVNNFDNSTISMAEPVAVPSLSPTNGGLDGAVLEVNNDELMVKFSSTTYNDLFMRALLIALETKIEPIVPDELEINDMHEYENLSSGKVLISGEVSDWCKLKNLLRGLKSRCELVIKHACPEQAARLININKKVSNLVEQVIEHKLGILDGQLRNDMLWYHYDTFEFSGMVCDLALTTTFKYGRNIHINTILSERAKLQISEEDTPFKMPIYNIVTIAKQNKLSIKDYGELQVLDSELSVFKTE